MFEFAGGIRDGAGERPTAAARNGLGRWSIWAGIALILTATQGCAPKSRIQGDPFRRTAAPPTVPDDPRYRTGGTFDRANDSARARDAASDVATTPLTEPRVADANAADPFVPASQSKRQSGDVDPFLNARSGDSPVASPKIDAAQPNVANLTGTRFEMYESIRQRLDKAHAQHFHFDRDPATNETIFTCELPYPDNASLFHVFEAKSQDELKAMQAVTEQVERWVGERKG